MKKAIELFKTISPLFFINRKPEDNKKLESEIENIIKEETGIEDTILAPRAVEQFKNISVGDIVLAKRTNKDDSNIIIKEGHKVGPFLVLENKGDKLLCAYGSSNCTKNQDGFTVDFQNYTGLTKTTRFYISNLYEITLETFIKELDTLSNYDRHIFQKKINILARKNSFFKKYAHNIYLEPGDIFKYNKEFYLIYKLENNRITAIRVSTTIPSDYKFTSDKKVYYICFDDIIEIKFSKNYVVHDFVPKDIYKKILAQLKKYFEEENRKKIIQRGSVIKFENRMIYIYSEESQFYLGYSVNNLSKKDKFPVIINQQKYSANFGEIYQINKNSEYTIVTTVSEEEATYNKTVKKSYNKLKSKLKLESEKAQNIPKENIKEGVIVSDSTFLHTEYIVLKRDVDELLTLMINAENNNVHFLYLDISQVDFDRELEKEEFKKILVQLRENQNKYSKYIDQKTLNRIMDKFSVSF